MKKVLVILALSAVSAFPATIAPVNPNATAATISLYNYLQNIKGQYILSGQESMSSDLSGDTTSRDKYVHGKTGKMPAVFSANFGDNLAEKNEQPVVDMVKKQVSKYGGKTIITLCWHADQPDTPTTAGYNGMKVSNYPTANIDSILKPGTKLNVEWLKRLDTIAGYLDQLQTANIPVIWRPFHENNGNFFWWGQQPRFKELWQQEYDYFTNTKKLNNLLWEFCSNNFTQGETWVGKNYPGDAYVDILSVDIYTQNQQFNKYMYDTLMNHAKSKPVAISENGTMPDVATLFTQGQYYTYWATWFGFEGTTVSDGEPGNSDALYTSNYTDPHTITRDEIDYSVASDGKKAISVSATNGGSVTTSLHGRIDSGAVDTLKAIPATGFSFTGWSGDTTATTPVLVLKVAKDMNLVANFTPDAGTNLVTNGDFSAGSTGWGSLNLASGTDAAATVDFTSGKAVVTITGAGTLGWHIQLAQSGIAFDSGVTYVLTFDASASAARTLSVDFSTGANSDTSKAWKWVGGGSVSLTTTTTNFSMEVTALRSAPSGVLQLGLGGATPTVTIDNVILVKKTSAIAFRSTLRSTSPTWSIVRSGSSIDWTRSEAIAKGGVVRLVGVDGRELSRAAVAAGAKSGSLKAPGTGIAFLVLETSEAREVKTLPLMR